jgi:hypothetical protein
MFCLKTHAHRRSIGRFGVVARLLDRRVGRVVDGAVQRRCHRVNVGSGSQWIDKLDEHSQNGSTRSAHQHTIGGSCAALDDVRTRPTPPLTTRAGDDLDIAAFTAAA